MFAKSIIDSDAFLDMPLSAQALYFHLSMRADDDGFVNNPNKIQKMTGATDDDCKLLIAKNFVISFENGIIVIRHWKTHNYLRSDRYKETQYKAQKSLLKIDENNAYILASSTVGIPTVSKMDTQVRIGKDSIGKVNNIYRRDNCFFDFANGDNELLTALTDFEQMRKSIKKPMTDRAKNLLISKLKGLTSNKAEMIEILNQSILNCWQSIYPLQTESEARDKGKKGGSLKGRLLSEGDKRLDEEILDAIRSCDYD